MATTDDTSAVTESKETEMPENCVQTETKISDSGGSGGSEDCNQSQHSSEDTNQSVNEISDTEMVSIKIIFNKQKFDVQFPVDNTIAKLKEHVQTLTEVPPAMQKIMLKGLAKDQSSLRDLGVSNGTKIMVVGSKPTDIQSVKKPSAKEMEEEAKKSAGSKEPLSKQKNHKTVLDKHKKPDDIVPGIRNVKEPLPSVPLSGMYNKSGGKVRLTFKLELDQLWLGTKERTEKIPMSSIKSVVSEPIEDHEEYHILGLQLGPTEASRYWIYWVPAQYVDSIKDTILGKWQFF